MTENRYRYLDAHGKSHGPVWLAEMRRLWKTGRLRPETMVSCEEEGGGEWEPLTSFPEITSTEAMLPPSAGTRPARANSFSWGVWAALLLLAVFMFVVYYFFPG